MTTSKGVIILEECYKPNKNQDTKKAESRFKKTIENRIKNSNSDVIINVRSRVYCG